MRKLIVILFVLTGLQAIYCQEKLNAINMPSSPAAYVLGVQPGAVLSPKSYQALETALFSNFLNNKGGVLIPNDFALEFTPYWTKNHNLSLENYLFPQNIWEDQVFRNSSFSVASTQRFLLGDSTQTNGLAFGYRTTVYFGNETDRQELAKFRNSLSASQKIQSGIGAAAEKIVNDPSVKDKETFLAAIRGRLVKLIYEVSSSKNVRDLDALVSEIYKESMLLPELDKDDPDKFLDAFYNLIDTKLKSKQLFNSFKSYISNRNGISVDVAYAALVNFPTNNFEFSIAPRQSLWITPAYRFKDENYLKVMAVLRYEWYNSGYYQKYFPKSKYFENNFDYGIAVSGDFQNLSVQIEAVGRKSSSEFLAGTDASGRQLYTKDSNSGFQYLGTFTYRLNDQIVLNYSLGKSFDPVLNPGSTLVSQLSINFGFGTPTTDDIKVE